MRLWVTGTMSSAVPWTSSCGTPSGASAAGEAAAKRSDRRLAQEALHRAAAEPFLVRRAARSRTPAWAIAASGCTRGPAQRDPAGEPVTGREPDGEVTTGRVTARDDTARVDVVEVGQSVEGGRDVVERAGPPTARLPDAPVLDVPGGDPAPGEVVRERRHQRAIPPRAPEASVQEHDAGPWPALGRGQVEVRDLIGVVAVREARRRRRGDSHSLRRCPCEQRSGLGCRQRMW